MNNRKFFRNAAIAFGLLAAGSSFAAETSLSAPVANTPAQHEGAPAGMHPKMEQMTPEQHEAFRAEMKAKMDKMSPEQREAMRAEMKAKMDNMSPEQREAMRTEMKARMDKLTPEQRAAMKSEHMEHRVAHREHRAERSGK